MNTPETGKVSAGLQKMEADLQARIDRLRPDELFPPLLCRDIEMFRRQAGSYCGLQVPCAHCDCPEKIPPAVLNDMSDIEY